MTGKTYEQVAFMVRGEPGSVVKVGVKGEGGVRDCPSPRGGDKLTRDRWDHTAVPPIGGI